MGGANTTRQSEGRGASGSRALDAREASLSRAGRSETQGGRGVGGARNAASAHARRGLSDRPSAGPAPPCSLGRASLASRPGLCSHNGNGRSQREREGCEGWESAGRASEWGGDWDGTRVSGLDRPRSRGDPGSPAARIARNRAGRARGSGDCEVAPRLLRRAGAG